MLNDEQWMTVALEEARAAAAAGDVPVGAVIVADDGKLIGRGRNRRELDRDPTAHAEIVALREAAHALNLWRVEATMFVTQEPCPMCAGAIQQARVARLVFGAPDQKVGAAGTVVNPLQDPRLLHRVEVQGGVLAADALSLLRSFFDERR